MGMIISPSIIAPGVSYTDGIFGNQSYDTNTYNMSGNEHGIGLFTVRPGGIYVKEAHLVVDTTTAGNKFKPVIYNCADQLALQSTDTLFKEGAELVFPSTLSASPTEYSTNWNGDGSELFIPEGVYAGPGYLTDTLTVLRALAAGAIKFASDTYSDGAAATFGSIGGTSARELALWAPYRNGAAAAKSGPTIVQSAQAISSGSSLTLGAAPTSGNLLIAISTHFSNGGTLQSGWTRLLATNGSNDGFDIAYKIAGSSESATQTATVFGTAGNNLTLFEVSGANTNISSRNLVTVQESTVASLSQASVMPLRASCLVLGAFFACATSSRTPTLSGTGVNQIAQTNGNGTATSANPRSIATFYGNPGANTPLTPTATYSAAVDQYVAMLTLMPA